MTLHRQLPALFLCVGLAAGAASCGSTLDSSGYAARLRELSQHRQVWTNAHLTSYDFTYTNDCFCATGGQPVIVTVRNGAITSLTYERTGQPVEAVNAGSFYTIDQLFDRIDTAITSKPHSFAAVYADPYGYPENVAVDPVANAVDDEYGFHIGSFQPVP